MATDSSEKRSTSKRRSPADEATTAAATPAPPEEAVAAAVAATGSEPEAAPAATAPEPDPASVKPRGAAIPVSYLLPRAEQLVGVPTFVLQGALEAAGHAADDEVSVTEAKNAVQDFNQMRAPGSLDNVEEA